MKFVQQMNLELGYIIHDGYSMYCILLDWSISKVSQMEKKLGEYIPLVVRATPKKNSTEKF